MEYKISTSFEKEEKAAETDLTSTTIMGHIVRKVYLSHRRLGQVFYRNFGQNGGLPRVDQWSNFDSLPFGTELIYTPLNWNLF